jgi:hypothetical protein
MNEGICDFKFAICDLPARFVVQALSLTPRFSGVWHRPGNHNRFSGFLSVMKTAEAVQALQRSRITPLKRGVNETRELGVWLALGVYARFAVHVPRAVPVESQMANRKSKIP